jgi:uncharacterized protein (DUF111 family)
MIAYFDCFSGISGDMTLGAFIDLGAPVKWLKETLRSIPLTGFDITVSSVSRHGITAKSVHVYSEDNAGSRDYTTIRSLIEKSPLSAALKFLKGLQMLNQKYTDVRRKRFIFMKSAALMP